jgi:hypothetical protein
MKPLPNQTSPPSPNQIGCCTGALLLAGASMLLLLAAFFLPVSSGDAPIDAVALSVNLGPQVDGQAVDSTSVPIASPGRPRESVNVNLAESEIISLLGRFLSGKLTVQCSPGQLWVQGVSSERMQATGWLTAEQGFLRVRLDSAAWRGIPMPRPVMWLASSQANASLENLFPAEKVVSVRAQEGHLALELRSKGEGK